MVVDDSAFNRRTIGDLLEGLNDVEVVGKAADGDEALKMAASLAPDLITLDLEMPRMDGFTFLRLLMARRPTPVIVVSGNSARENVFRALELGAIDFIAKPTRTITSDLSAIEQELREKVEMIRLLSPAARGLKKRSSTFRSTVTAKRAPSGVRAPEPRETQLSRLVLIGASTGGPSALVEVFSRFKSGSPAAIVVAQHMPERFTRTFAERLNRLGGFKVVEAKEFEPLFPGKAVLCPGGKCIEVVQFGNGLAASVVDAGPSDRFVPSVDRLFRSAAQSARERAVGVVLTGMGDDGARGVVALKATGGMVIAEAPETAVIYGMPGAAMRTGEVDKSLPLGELANYVAELIV